MYIYIYVYVFSQANARARAHIPTKQQVATNPSEGDKHPTSHPPNDTLPRETRLRATSSTAADTGMNMYIYT